MFLEFPVFEQILVVFNIFFIFIGNFTRQTIIDSCIRTCIGITWIITLGEEGTKSTMGIRNFMKESG